MSHRNGYIYDVEVFPNLFTLAVKSVRSGERRVYEISNRRNDLVMIVALVTRMQRSGAIMIGYNNLGYDYPVLHHLLTSLNNFSDALYICKKLYERSQEIIATPFERRFDNIVWDRDQLVPQMDLFKVHHFDNPNRATSLKILEFNMRMDDIRESPVPFGTYVEDDQIQGIIDYNYHDIESTFEFYLLSIDMLDLREELESVLNKKLYNHSDAKIGSDFFVNKLESSLGKDICFTKVEGKRKARQTKRSEIDLSEVIFDYVHFETPEFKAVHNWIASQVITNTKAVFTEIEESSLGELRQYANLAKKKGKVKALNCIVDGVQFKFGTGGIHASIEKRRVISDEEYVIIDLDVEGYYPSIAIANRTYPEHLGEEFCRINLQVKEERSQYPKGTPRNKTYKLAGNAVYGNSNNKFSCFFDPKYTMTITINGQLMLCMLYEQLRKINGLELIQVNTDGLTIRVPRKHEKDVDRAYFAWELMTGLVMEKNVYSMMFIRDVNNYIAVSAKDKSKVKYKGAYEFNYVEDAMWHKNFSSLVVKKAAAAYILEGVDPKDFIPTHEDDYDFMLRTKVPKSSRLIGEWGYEQEVLQNVSRYYISKSGCELFKVMPPLAKKPGVERWIGVNKDCLVTVMNKMEPLDRSTVDYDWYIDQAIKLIKFEGEYEDEEPDTSSCNDR